MLRWFFTFVTNAVEAEEEFRFFSFFHFVFFVAMVNRKEFSFALDFIVFVIRKGTSLRHEIINSDTETLVVKFLHFKVPCSALLLLHFGKGRNDTLSIRLQVDLVQLLDWGGHLHRIENCDTCFYYAVIGCLNGCCRLCDYVIRCRMHWYVVYCHRH